MIDGALAAAGTIVAALSADAAGRRSSRAMRNEGVLYHGLHVLGGGSILGGLILGAIAVFIIDRDFIEGRGFAAGRRGADLLRLHARRAHRHRRESDRGRQLSGGGRDLRRLREVRHGRRRPAASGRSIMHDAARRAGGGRERRAPHRMSDGRRRVRAFSLTDLFRIRMAGHAAVDAVSGKASRSTASTATARSGPTAALLRFKAGARVAAARAHGLRAHHRAVGCAGGREQPRRAVGTLIINPPRHPPQRPQRTRLHRAGHLREAGEVPRLQRSPSHDASGRRAPRRQRHADAGAGAQSQPGRRRRDFVRESATAPTYRLWSIGDRHPGDGSRPRGRHRRGRRSLVGSSRRPRGDSPERAARAEHRQGDPWPMASKCSACSANRSLCEGQREITEFGSWRKYVGERRP